MVAFAETNRKAAATEQRVAAILLRAGWWVQHRLAYASPHDIAVMNNVGSGACLIEVKDESNYSDSANLCIETFQGQPHRYSGIFASQSNICIHVFGDECYLYKTRYMMLYLMQSIAEKTLEPKSLRNSDNFNFGVLIPKIKLMMPPFNKFCDHQQVEYITQSKLFQLNRQAT